LLEKISAEAVKLSQAIQSLRKKMEHPKPGPSQRRQMAIMSPGPPVANACQLPGFIVTARKSTGGLPNSSRLPAVNGMLVALSIQETGIGVW